MSDRLTQLQDLVNQQATNFCNAVGMLQQMAPPSRFASFERNEITANTLDDLDRIYAMQIARTAKDIEAVIDSLPNDDSALERQVASLKRLEEENQAAAEKLRQDVKKGKHLYGRVQEILSDIAHHELNMKNGFDR